jgi:arylsulfatase A-like enzyme
MSFGLAILPSSGCRRATGVPPNIIVISTDTVRRDSVFSPLAGVELPNLGRFAEDSVLLTNAYSTISFTLPAHISLMTGHHHTVHGVVNDKSVLSPSISTLPELLVEQGYATAGLFTSEWLDPAFGFGRGFDSYEEVRQRPRYADRVIDRALTLIDEDLGQRQPFFLFLHLFDAHSDFGNQSKSRLPYHSPSDYRGDLPPDVETRFCLSGKTRCATAFLVAADQNEVELSAEDAAMLKTLYTRGVECLDDDLAELFSGLKERGLYEDSLIIVLSDHGEEFHEHGRFLHSQVYEETVGIPIIVKLPQNRGAGSRVEKLTSLMSVNGMIREIVEASRKKKKIDVDDLSTQYHASILMQDKLRQSIWALRSGSWKLVTNTETQTSELFQLDDDPEESTDISAAHPDVVARLSRQLDDERVRLQDLGLVAAGNGGDEVQVLDPAERERLEALGYVD